MIRILDLDNCIADDSHRICAINWSLDGERRYLDYHQLAAFDEIGNVDLLETNEDIIILTGRPVVFRAMTMRWLRLKRVRWFQLLMRNEGDLRHSADLKRDQLRWLQNYYNISPCDITSAFDDREDVVEMYKREGIRRAEVRAIHQLDAYTR